MRHSIADAGYRVGCAIASDNLSLGKTVIADAVNPMIISRKAWRQVADHARTTAVEVEMICSDAGKHKRRVELRKPDIPGLKNPTWKDVLAREYQPWDRNRILVDTATIGIEKCVSNLYAAVQKQVCR